VPRARSTRPQVGTGLSLRAFAARMGVSHPAVRKAIRSGRLKESIGDDGRIKDAAVAEREWRAGAAKPGNNGGNGALHGDGTLVAAQVRVAAERAIALELSNRRRRGEVHDVAACARAAFDDWRTLRDRILNVPDRLAELDPALRARIRAELRQALGAVADELERG
jgi:phage terminase Nu1 subunit (DNA packaging protein)